MDMKKVINKHGMEYWKVESNSSPEVFYYVTPLLNPAVEWKELVWLCTCKSFTMAKVRAGKNPLTDPCKHIVAVRNKRNKGRSE